MKEDDAGEVEEQQMEPAHPKQRWYDSLLARHMKDLGPQNTGCTW